MYLITFDTQTRRIKSCGEINPKCMLDVLPPGAAYVDVLPGTPIMDYLYTESGQYVLSKEETDDADDSD